jgi:hypothetical protein
MLFRLSRAVTCLFLLPSSFLIQSAPAQIQQAWVAHYKNGILNGTNQAVKIALDSTGSIYVLGFSENTNTNLGYVTIKYAPNGNDVWAARYDDTNYPAATPSSFALDSNNNVIVTGSALTVKYDSNGNQLWTAPYDGAAIAIDGGGNSIVTGFASTFDTVKISPNATNLWLTSYIEPNGPVVSQAVVVDAAGNSYVAGSDTYVCYSDGPYLSCYDGPLLVKYDPNGNQLWKNVVAMSSLSAVQVEGLAIDKASNVYMVINSFDRPVVVTYKYASEGGELWAGPSIFNISPAFGLAVDSTGRTFITGEASPTAPSYPNMSYGTLAFATNGISVWTNYYPQIPTTLNAGTAIAVDQTNGVYITGYSTCTNGTNDIVTIKYDQIGNQIWLQRYTSPGNGNAAGNAITVDNHGNVYVTGYDTTPAGGTEIVTIKYSPVTPQRRSDCTVILQAQGSPGESFDIEASEDLLNWLDLGSVLADTNGLIQFDDTNAPAYPARFYYTTPQ